MKYSITYSSRTGNTERLAEALREMFSEETRIYFGPLDDAASYADMIFVGFWTDKGSCDEEVKLFLKKLKGKTVFLFGTAGFGGSEEYFSKIMNSVRSNLDGANCIAGSFMCQGRMPEPVLRHYEKMLSEASDPARIQHMIDNFHKASAHPDPGDLERLKAEVQSAFSCQLKKGVVELQEK